MNIYSKIRMLYFISHISDCCRKEGLTCCSNNSHIKWIVRRTIRSKSFMNSSCWVDLWCQGIRGRCGMQRAWTTHMCIPTLVQPQQFSPTLNGVCAVQLVRLIVFSGVENIRVHLTCRLIFLDLISPHLVSPQYYSANEEFYSCHVSNPTSQLRRPVFLSALWGLVWYVPRYLRPPLPGSWPSVLPNSNLVHFSSHYPVVT